MKRNDKSGRQPKYGIYTKQIKGLLAFSTGYADANDGSGYTGSELTATRH